MKEAELSPQGETKRANSWGQAYAITERPTFGYDGTPESITPILDWLDVEGKDRWKPTGNTTYCNVYAHDLCKLLGAYIPRVWWTEEAWSYILAGKIVHPLLGRTVVELSANSLYDWLEGKSDLFYWQKLKGPDQAQELANAGRPVVVCAKRHAVSDPGHIAVIVPESSSVQAIRRDGAVLIPVQSQAGAKRYKLATNPPGDWWLGSQFSKYGFWGHVGETLNK